MIAITALINDIFAASLTFCLMGIAYWRGDRIWRILAGFALSIYGAGYFATTIWLGLIMMVAGIYTILKGILSRN